MHNKLLLRSLIVAISLISAFFLQDSLLSEHASAAGTAPDVRMTARILDISVGSSTLPRAGIQISPSAVAFPNQTVGAGSSAVVVDIRNFTGSALTLGSYALSGVNTSDFLVQNFPNNAVLQPDEQRSFSVFFVPTAVGSRSASIAFPTSAASNPTVTIPLSGTGVIVTPTPTPTPFPGGQTSFTYQGKLVESGANVSTPRDLKFKLFNDENNTQIGSDVVFANVSVRDGIFNVVLDFGSAVFTGGPRSLEISVSYPAANAYTALSPRQPITPTPYAVRSLNALNAATATDTQQLGGVPANQFVVTSDTRMSDSRDPTAGSANYVQNQNTSPQALANFSIDGTGSANVINASTQFNLGGYRVLTSINGADTYVGVGAGTAAVAGDGFNTFGGYLSGSVNSSGSFNTFYGAGSGKANLTGRYNTFNGYLAGYRNTDGGWNTFVGNSAGDHNLGGSFNTFIGEGAAKQNTTGSNITALGANTSVTDGLTYATAIGAGSSVSTSNTLVLGRPADTVNVPGTLSVAGTFGASIFNASTQFNLGGTRFLGTGGLARTSLVGDSSGYSLTTGTDNTLAGYSAGFATTSGSNNVFFGGGAGAQNSTGSSNSFFGRSSGNMNVTGSYTTAIGAAADIQTDGLMFATAIGSFAKVNTSNTIVIGKQMASVGGTLYPADTVKIPGKLAVDGSATSGSLYVNTLGPNAATHVCWNSTTFQFSTCSTPLAEKDELVEFNGAQAPASLVNAIKEQQARIDAQAKQIEQLTKLVCSMLPTAAVCLKPAEKK